MNLLNYLNINLQNEVGIENEVRTNLQTSPDAH